MSGVSGGVDEALWALGRGTGAVALVLLTASVLLGVLTSRHRPTLGLPRYGVAELHRHVSLLASVLVALHVLTLLVDPLAPVRLLDVLVPFAATWRPVWMGLGTLGLLVMAAVVVTALARRRLGQRTFKAVHWLAYALWPMAFAHSLGTGTDAGTVWFGLLALGCAAVVAGAVVFRLIEPDRLTRSPDSRRVPSSAASSAPPARAATSAGSSASR